MHVIDVVETADTSRVRLKQIHALLVTAFGDTFTPEDWEHTLGGWHVTVVEAGAVVAHAAVTARTLHINNQVFRSGYVEGVATMPARQGRGLGSMVMSEATNVVRTNFELGALSTGRHGFYERLGWERWRGPTFVRRGSRVVRTPDEDAGVMVLRFGTSQTVDLAAGISCEDRRGDDW